MPRKTIDDIEREYAEAMERGEELVPITMDDVLKAQAAHQKRKKARFVVMYGTGKPRKR